MIKYTGIAAVIVLAATSLAQSAPAPAAAAIYIPNSQIQTVAQRNAGAPVSDQQIRVIGVNGEYNVGVGVVHRAKTEKQSVGGSEHSQITEVYHVISGEGTLVTGGTIENAKARAATNEAVRVLTGPSMEGTRIIGGTSRNIGPGDVIVIPPNTPHTFTEITSPEIVYLVVRFDPHKVLPAGYTAK
jgi:mannose-6-phosphate isomerase-like protein (cupin superfamily)